MIRRTLLAAAAVLALGTSAAMAQSATQEQVGSFVYNNQGAVIGSLKAVDGNQAVVWIGMFNTPGNHLETVPLSQLASNGGQLVLNGTGDASHLAAR